MSLFFFIYKDFFCCWKWLTGFFSFNNWKMLLYCLIMNGIFLLCTPAFYFWLDDKHYEFSLSNTRYFCISINILEFCSEMYLIDLKIVWHLQDFLSNFVRQTQTSLYSRTNLVSLWTNTLLNTLPHAWLITKFFLLSCRSRNISGSVCLLGLVPSFPFRPE